MSAVRLVALRAARQACRDGRAGGKPEEFAPVYEVLPWVDDGVPRRRAAGA